MVHEPEGACRGNWRARPVGPENLTLRLTRIKPARPPSKRHSAGARALTSCHRLFISPPRVAARIRRTPPGGPPGGALRRRRRARGLLGFDVPRCTVPMFLMLSVQLPLRLPQLVSALFDSPLLFGIHPQLPALSWLQPTICPLPLQNTHRLPRAAACRQHTGARRMANRRENLWPGLIACTGSRRDCGDTSGRSNRVRSRNRPMGRAIRSASPGLSPTATAIIDAAQSGRLSMARYPPSH